MKLFNTYPGQKFCFAIGFFSTGIWVSVLAVGVDAFLNVLSEQEQSSLFALAIKTFLIYGIIGGVCGHLMGGWLRSSGSRFADNWVWLSFLIPQVAFAVAGVVVDLQNMIECKRILLPNSLAVWTDGLALYVAAAALPGLMAASVLGSIRLITKIGGLRRRHP